MGPARRLVVLLCLLGMLALPAAALAQSSPFSPLPSPTPDPVPTPTVSTPVAPGDRGLSTGSVILIAAGTIAVFVGIGYLILRDARSSVPSERGAQLGGSRAQRRDKTPDAGAALDAAARPSSRARKQQVRRKGRAQKAARRRNR